MKSWKEYFKKQEKREVREQLIRALSFCGKKDYALDLGSGNFIESKFLAKRGFKKIVAIDNSRDVQKYTKNLGKKIKFKNISFQEYNYPKNAFDLITAQFALPFYGKKGFKSFIQKTKNSLKTEGIFVGQFFGKKDSWSGKRPGLIFHTKQQALDLLSGMEILEFIEEEKDGKTALGISKHWHIFHFIVRKR